MPRIFASGGNLDPIFGFGLSFGTGGFRVNFNFTLDQRIGDFTGSYGLGVTYHSNFFMTGHSGIEFRNSFMVNYDDGKTGISLGTNIWTGARRLRQFNQRTGMLSYRNGEFACSYENDGTPFQWLKLGDGDDRYRTAAGSLSIGDISLNMNLLTGLRNRNSYKVEGLLDLKEGCKNGKPMGKGQFGENYTHGFVVEKGPKYRYGGLTLNYQGMSAGINSEWIRHGFQNILAHHVFQPQRQFPMLSNYLQSIANFSNSRLSKFTIWGD